MVIALTLTKLADPVVEAESKPRQGALIRGTGAGKTMKRKSLFQIILLLALLLPAKILAKGRTLALSLNQAVQRALQRHPLLTASNHAAQGARARTAQTKTAWLPRVKLETNYFLVGPVSKMVIDTGVTIPGQPGPVVINNEIGSLHNASLGITVGWRAFDFGARDVRTAALRALEQVEKAQGRERAVKIAYAVRGAYLAALFFQEVAHTTARSMKSARIEMKEQKIRRQAGLGNDLDLARIELRIADLSARLIQARQERQRALTGLRLLLGIAPAQLVKLTDRLHKLGSRKELSQTDRSGHPSFQKLKALAQAARLQHKSLSRAYWPTLDLIGSLKLQYPKNFFEKDKAGVAYTAGLLLSWNVFDGDLLRRQRLESLSKLHEVRALKRAADEEITRKLADTKARIRTAEAAREATDRALAAARVYLKAARTSRQAGIGTALEVRKAEESLDRAELGKLKAYFDGALARAALRQALGQIGSRR